MAYIIGVFSRTHAELYQIENEQDVDLTGIIEKMGVPGIPVSVFQNDGKLFTQTGNGEKHLIVEDQMTEVDSLKGICLYARKNRDNEPVVVRLEQGRDVVIGRSNTAQYVIENQYLSREHVKLRRQEDTLFVEDLDSTCGTYYDGNRIREIELKPNEEFLVLGMRFVFDGENLRIHNLFDRFYSNMEKNDVKTSSSESIIHIVLFAKNGMMDSMSRRLQDQGHFFFDDKLIAKTKLWIKEEEGQLSVECGEDATIYSGTQLRGNAVKLEDSTMLEIKCEDTSYVLYWEVIEKNEAVMTRYRVEEGSVIHIGYEDGNEIYYDNRFISREHAVIRYQNGEFSIEDVGSRNGVYVNDHRAGICRLSLGDRIYIMGLILVVGSGFLMINGNHPGVRIDDSCLKTVTVPEEIKDHIEKNNHSNILEDYHRKPRRRCAMPSDKIKLEAPPSPMSNNGIPLFLRTGSSMVMGASGLIHGNITTMLTSVLFPVMTQKYTEKQKAEYEEKRKKYYTRYLYKKKEFIQHQINKELETLQVNYPNLNNIFESISQNQMLWERRISDDDFLNIRIGTGDLPMNTTIDFPEERINLEEDELEDAMYEIARKKYYLPDAPILISLIEDKVLGVQGSMQQKIEFAKRLILQTVLLHSYEEVKCIFLLDENTLEKLHFIMDLPHVWNDLKNKRFIATDLADAVSIGEDLRVVLEKDLDKSQELERILKQREYYILFSFDEKLYDSIEILKEVVKEKENIGISVISFTNDLPKECTKLIKLGATGNEVIFMRELEKENQAFWSDSFDSDTAEAVLSKIANIKTVSKAGNENLPKMVNFLQMFGVGKIEHLNVRSRWNTNNLATSLKTPIGIGTDGDVFYLDLHEKAQGPHGLVAGMTGSGKSEFILTYILSMAINYHPDDVAFLLIDYKGGGLAGAFDDPGRNIRLPHLVGTITNLDGDSIQRSIVSLQGEMLRRQKVFNEAKSIANEGTMNIYEYQRLYHSGIVKEAIPHLFIISDEFAELKTQKPEFMDHLISIARIGRSLGVHLILATQKPSGIVNDQILSNTKFRVCLKVQDKADSNDLLKRPDAAELKDTGRFYLQVGYNEYFAMGQSAWCGAPYEPQEKVVKNKDESVQFIDNLGRAVLTKQPVVRKEESGISQLVAIVRYLSDIAKQDEITQKELWMPALPKTLEFRDFTKLYREEEPFSVALGRIDDPANQKQYLWTLDFLHLRHLWVNGLMESGKSIFLESAFLMLADHLSPQDLQFYLLSYSRPSLSLLKTLPHCGAVLGEDELSYVDRFFDVLNEIIDERKVFYEKNNISSFEAAREIKRLPLVIVAIDNIRVFKESKAGDKYFYGLPELLKKCMLYGIKFIITSSLISDVPTRLRNELGDRLIFHFKDKYDAMEVLGSKVVSIPADTPGRGLLIHEERPLEFQSVMYGTAENTRTRMACLKKFIQEVAERNPGDFDTKRIEMNNQEDNYQDFCKKYKPGRFPIGYSMVTGSPIVFPLKQFSMLSIYYSCDENRIAAMENILYWAKKEKMQITIFTKRRGGIFSDDKSEIVKDDDKINILRPKEENEDYDYYRLSNDVISRKDLFTEYCESRNIDPHSEQALEISFEYMRENTIPRLIIIEDLKEFCTCISEEARTTYRSIFPQLRKCNIYVIGCLEKKCVREIGENSLLCRFNTDKNIIIYGGVLEIAGLLEIPYEIRTRFGEMDVNQCIMQYKNKFHPIVVPYEKEVIEVAEDDREIF